MTERTSVIIPTLNESTTIETCLSQFDDLPGAWERIVVDGGSSDGTRALAIDAGADQVIEAPRGRGVQLDRGARAATAPTLLFLHSDVRLPRDAHRWIRDTLDGGAIAGCFRTRTESDGSRGRWFAPVLRLADMRSRITHRPYGDQALFLRARVYEETGGFRPLPIMEDLEYSERLARFGRIRTVPAVVRVSGRRFELAPLRSLVTMNTFPMLFRCGVPVDRLARMYGAPRQVE